MLDTLVYQGKLQAVHAGYKVYYRRRIVVHNLAITTGFAYNPARRNKFPLDKDIDPFLQALNPLRLGKAALLWMDDPLPQKKTVQDTPKKTLVIIVPGQTIQLPKSSVLVSLVGKGSCVMRLGEPKKVAGLVLAGMPLRLARELSTRINRVLQGA